MKVTVRNIRGGEDNVAGTIEWTDKGWIITPGSSRLLYNLLADGVRIGDKEWTSEEGDRYLEVLHAMYDSPYLRVSKPE